MLPTVQISETEVKISAIRAQGAGGQNVNKVSSAIHLRFDIAASSLDAAIKTRLLALNDGRITQHGVVILKAQQFRTRELNRLDALERLQRLINQVAAESKPRKPTRPTYASKQRRLASKAQRSAMKAGRRSAPQLA